MFKKSAIYRHITRALELFNSHKYDLALKEIDKALEIDDKDYDLHVLKSIIFLNLAQYNEALNEINIALLIDNSPFAYATKSFILTEQGNLKDALSILDNIEDLEEYEEIILQKASLLILMDRIKEALALIKNMNSTSAHYIRSYAYYKLKDYEKSLNEIDVIKENTVIKNLYKYIINIKQEKLYNIDYSSIENNNSLIMFLFEYLNGIYSLKYNKYNEAITYFNRALKYNEDIILRSIIENINSINFDLDHKIKFYTFKHGSIVSEYIIYEPYTLIKINEQIHNKKYRLVHTIRSTFIPSIY